MRSVLALLTHLAGAAGGTMLGCHFGGSLGWPWAWVGIAVVASSVAAWVALEEHKEDA